MPAHCWSSSSHFADGGGPLKQAVQELHERGVAFVSLKEGLDLSTAAGRLQLHILSALGEFERARLIERTRAGLARARRQGTRLGRRPVRLTETQLADVAHLPVWDAARQLGVSVNTYQKARRVSEIRATAEATERTGMLRPRTAGTKMDNWPRRSTINVACASSRMLKFERS